MTLIRAVAHASPMPRKLQHCAPADQFVVREQMTRKSNTTCLQLIPVPWLAVLQSRILCLQCIIVLLTVSVAIARAFMRHSDVHRWDVVMRWNAKRKRRGCAKIE